MRRFLPRLYRLGVLVAAVCLVHAQHQRLQSAKARPILSVQEVTNFFPKAATLEPPKQPYDLQRVVDASGGFLGLVCHTSPQCDHLRGYTGASDVLIAMDPTGTVLGCSLRSSEDTADHVDAIVESDRFWSSFQGMDVGAPSKPEVDAVSGSTLTSNAITLAIIERLGGVANSDLFPTGILLVEVQQFLPEAATLTDHPNWPGVQRVLDQQGALLGNVLRTAPSQDALIGYQGPTDMLIVLDATASRVTALRFRKSYDNEEYYERILDDDDYLKLYDGRPIEEVAGFDVASAGIDVVSGATNTSWAIAESVKRRMRLFLADRDRPPPAPILSGRDLGLILVTLGGLLMSFTRLRGKAWLRTAWQILLVLYLGFLSGDLVSQALLAGWAQSGIDLRNTIGLLFLVAASFLIPWTTGHQLYCHHLCPHGALQQWLRKLPLKKVVLPQRAQQVLATIPLLLLALVLASVLFGIGLNLAAIEPFDAYLFRVAGWASISIAIVGLAASAFVPLAYCRYGCPTGLLLKFMRSHGATEQFGRRDVIAGALVLVAALIVLGSPMFFDSGEIPA